MAWTGKILRVNLSTGTAEAESVEEEDRPRPRLFPPIGGKDPDPEPA